METIKNFFQEMLYSIPTIRVTDVIDILVVAFLIYYVMTRIQSTTAARVARSILVLLLVTWITDLVHLYTMNWILEKILELGFIALVIMFQPELRRALERFGGKTMLPFTDPMANRSAEQMAITATVNACEIMSKERVGVLLIFERNTSLEEYFKTGTIIDARVTEQLLRNLFFPKASLHDGAVIIRAGRVAAAGCVMPLSENTHLSSDLGTRHRAGIGTSEVSDAVVVIVSEEAGTISVATGGMLKRHLAPQTLERLLTNELLPEQENQPKNPLAWVKSHIGRVVGREKQHEEK